MTKNKIGAGAAAFLLLIFTGAGNCSAEKNPDTKQTDLQSPRSQKSKMAKVTGIGGVFIKAKNPKEMAQWYQKNLGLSLESWGGAILKWSEDKADDGGLTVWNAMENSPETFKPSNSSFMINYRIDSMDKMLTQLKENGVKILQGPESHENGKFLWIEDPDGNKVELWEAKIWDEKNKKL